MPATNKSLYAIRCDTESGTLISSKIELEAWNAILAFVEILEHEKHISVKQSLFYLMDHEAHLASAGETYAWRNVIDSIKASDLSEVSSRSKSHGATFSALVKSKPIMLRMAGEISNALLHSYTNRHKITFFSV